MIDGPEVAALRHDALTELSSHCGDASQQLILPAGDTVVPLRACRDDRLEPLLVVVKVVDAHGEAVAAVTFVAVEQATSRFMARPVEWITQESVADLHGRRAPRQGDGADQREEQAAHLEQPVSPGGVLLVALVSA